MASPGEIAGFGDAPISKRPHHLGTRLVGVAEAHCGHGYWALDAAGKVFPFGCANLLGSLARRPPGGAVAIATAPGGNGYWVVSRDGDVYSFGGARFHGSLGKRSLGSPVIGIAPTPKGRGYWLATASGGIYSFGDARFFGSLRPRRSPVVGIAAAPRAKGYWLATAAGGVFSFGGAKFFGSAQPLHPVGANSSVTALASPSSAQGYWLLTARGQIYSFGAAPRFGWTKTSGAVEASVLAPTADGRGYFIGTAPARNTATAGARSVAHEQPRRHAVEQPPAQRSLRYIGTFMVTCYDLYGTTATGATAGPESVAVDPGVISLGTQIYVQGVGFRTADDTGGAIIGHHIDIWEPNYATCVNWGVQERPVYVVGSNG